MSAQNILLQTIIADETEGEEREERWSESYCLKTQDAKSGLKRQWIDGKGLETIESVLILKENIFSQSDVCMWDKTEQIIIMTRALVEQEREKSIPVAVQALYWRQINWELTEVHRHNLGLYIEHN